MNDQRRIKRALIVEDEALLAMEMAEYLTEAGYQVIGPVASVEKALRIIGNKGCDVAVLDVHLGTEHSEPVALALKAQSTPFIVVSGNSFALNPPGFAGAPSLPKPIMPATLVSLIQTCTGAME